MDLRLTKNCSLTVTLRHSVKFTIIKHTKVWKRRHDQQDYLGFYTLDSRHLSASVHGLLGRELRESLPIIMHWLREYFMFIWLNKCIFLQVSSTMGLGLRWQTCVQVKSLPPCMWRDTHSTWPGAHASWTHTHNACKVKEHFFMHKHTPHHCFLNLSRRQWQKDFSRDVKNGESVLCWFVDDDGAGLIDGRASDYIVAGLFKAAFWLARQCTGPTLLS